LLGVTAEALYTSENRLKIVDFCKRVGQYPPHCHVKGTSPPSIFARIYKPMNALQLCRWQFSHKETL